MCEIIFSTQKTFYVIQNTTTLKKLTSKRSFNLKQNYLTELKIMLELFYHDTKEIDSNNEDQMKYFPKEKLYLLQLLNYMISF